MALADGAIPRVRPAGGGGDLNEVAAGVVEDGGGDRTHGGGLLGEADAESAQALELRAHVLYGERREGDTVAHQRLLEGPGGGVCIRLQHELGAVRVVGR